jgi:hypothetical protein
VFERHELAQVGGVRFMIEVRAVMVAVDAVVEAHDAHTQQELVVANSCGQDALYSVLAVDDHELVTWRDVTRECIITCLEVGAHVVVIQSCGARGLVHIRSLQLHDFGLEVVVQFAQLVVAHHPNVVTVGGEKEWHLISDMRSE